MFFALKAHHTHIVLVVASEAFSRRKGYRG